MRQVNIAARRTLSRRLAPIGGLAVLILCGVALGSWLAGRLRSQRGLTLEPAIADLTDRVHAEGETVRARFRLVNPSSRPVTVDQFATSCTCTASLVEGGKSVPFTIEPSSGVDFWLEVHPTAQNSDLIQTVRAGVSSRCDGRPLPNVVAMMRILVEDPVKPQPASIQVGDAPAGEPLRRHLALTTVSPATKVSLPEVNVSDPNVIPATVETDASSALFDDRLTSHYRINVDLVPRRNDSQISGFVDVRVDGRSIRIPVECSFRRPYRLSHETVSFEGVSGRTVSRDIFYEAREPGWEDPEVVATPTGVKIAVKPFDKSTHMLTISALIPKTDARREGSTIILRPRGRDERIVIPIRYNAEE